MTTETSCAKKCRDDERGYAAPIFGRGFRIRLPGSEEALLSATVWDCPHRPGVIVLFSIIGGITGGGDSDSTTPAADDSSDTTDSKSADTQKTEPNPKWMTVAKLRGNTNKAGPDFRLNGCDTRMTYNVQGDVSSTLVAFYVMESGKKIMEDGGIPVASPTKAGRGNTTIRQDEGDYYIETIAANADWQVQVQEKC